MAEQQVRERNYARRETEEIREHPAKEAGKAVVAETTSVEEIDEMLAKIDEALEADIDEIDAALELDAEEFVQNYRQKGGE